MTKSSLFKIGGGSRTFMILAVGQKSYFRFLKITHGSENHTESENLKGYGWPCPKSWLQISFFQCVLEDNKNIGVELHPSRVLSNMPSAYSVARRNRIHCPRGNRLRYTRKRYMWDLVLKFGPPFPRCRLRHGIAVDCLYISELPHNSELLR